MKIFSFISGLVIGGIIATAAISMVTIGDSK